MSIKQEHISLFESANKIKEINKTNEEFNLLHAIGFNYQEVLHSKFIASLLQTNGGHQSGTLFLDEFLKMIGRDDLQKENFEIKTEKRAEKSRRMDIVLESSKATIIVENKLLAKDQDRQLEAYYTFCKKKNNDVSMIYLTPCGHQPSSESLGCVPKESVKCISYQKNIVEWLETCLESITPQNRLYHGILMYIESLRLILNNNKYMNELYDMLTQTENLNQTIDIYRSINNKSLLSDPLLFEKTYNYLVQLIYDQGYVANLYPKNDENNCRTIEIEQDENGDKDVNIILGFVDITPNEIIFQNSYHSHIDTIRGSLNDDRFVSIITQDSIKVNAFLESLLIKTTEK